MRGCSEQARLSAHSIHFRELVNMAAGTYQLRSREVWNEVWPLLARIPDDLVIRTTTWKSVAVTAATLAKARKG